MSVVCSDSKLVKELIATGIIPPNCTSWSIDAPAGGLIVMKTEVFVTPEQFQKIADALIAHPKEARKIRGMMFREIGGTLAVKV